MVILPHAPEPSFSRSGGSDLRAAGPHDVRQKTSRKGFSAPSDVLNKLVDQGNTVVIIEHNLDVIKSADHVIDLGPEGGAAGGRIVAQGTPEDVAKSRESYTGQFLAEILRVPPALAS